MNDVDPGFNLHTPTVCNLSNCNLLVANPELHEGNYQHRRYKMLFAADALELDGHLTGLIPK